MPVAPPLLNKLVLGPTPGPQAKETPTHMKKLALLFAAVFVAGVAVADDKPVAPNAASHSDKAAASAKTHEVEAEIVAVDAVKNTLTLKGETENKTVPVEGKAVASLKDVKVGSKVTLTCKDDEKGAHKAVVGIKAAPVAK